MTQEEFGQSQPFFAQSKTKFVYDIIAPNRKILISPPKNRLAMEQGKI
jgi:hypothetical protein